LPERTTYAGSLRLPNYPNALLIQRHSQDSGDPFVYAANAKEVYNKLGIDHTTKVIIYSDSLNLDKMIRLRGVWIQRSDSDAAFAYLDNL
jgi:hypothetical protein